MHKPRLNKAIIYAKTTDTDMFINIFFNDTNEYLLKLLSFILWHEIDTAARPLSSGVPWAG